MSHFEQLSVVPTVERQTPRSDFGAMVSQAVVAAAGASADAISVVAPGNPILSAAASGMRAVAQGAVRSSVAAPPAPGGSSDPTSALDANRQLMLQGAQMNLAYLQLQQQMQQESQQYTTLTNVMKVRYDSAKAAINNLR